MSDYEIVNRLSSIVDFTPWDQWTWVIDGLRNGKVYYIVEGESGTKCGFINGPNFGEIEDLLLK